MADYKEIVTKAVIGKAKKNVTNNYTLETDEVPDTILGCWVINHQFSGTNMNNAIYVNGSFDVNVWYSYDNDSKTAVSTKKFTYNDNLKMDINQEATTNPEVIVKSLKQPTVTDVKIESGLVNLTIDKELGVEIVGDTKIKVPVSLDFDDYVDLDASTKDDEIDNVQEDYLK